MGKHYYFEMVSVDIHSTSQEWNWDQLMRNKFRWKKVSNMMVDSPIEKQTHLTNLADPGDQNPSL